MKVGQTFVSSNKVLFPNEKNEKKIFFWLQHMNIVSSKKKKKNFGKFLRLKNLSFLVPYFILLTIVTKLVHRLQKSVAF